MCASFGYFIRSADIPSVTLAGVVDPRMYFPLDEQMRFVMREIGLHTDRGKGDSRVLAAQGVWVRD